MLSQRSKSDRDRENRSNRRKPCRCCRCSPESQNRRADAGQIVDGPYRTSELFSPTPLLDLMSWLCLTGLRRKALNGRKDPEFRGGGCNSQGLMK